MNDHDSLFPAITGVDAASGLAALTLRFDDY
jgi:hypothetical protein